MMHAEVPKVTDWMSAWAAVFSVPISLLAFMAASWAAWLVFQTNRSQSAQLKQLNERERMDQASGVAFRAEAPSATKAESTDEPYAGYINASKLPIYDASVHFVLGVSTVKIVELGTLLPTEHEQPLPTVLPIIRSYLEDGGGVIPGVSPFFLSSAAMFFTDTRGVRWCRVSAGPLIDLNDPPSDEASELLTYIRKLQS